MSDYLNTLVARTLRLVPVVQPRLASLFEPVPAGPANEYASEVFQTRSQPPRASGELPDLPIRETRTESRASNDALNEPGGVVFQSQFQSQPLPAPLMPPSVVAVNDTESIREVRGEQLPPVSPRSPHSPHSPRSIDSDSITTPSEILNNPTPSRIKPEVRIASTNDREQSQPSLATQPPAFAPPAPLPQSRKVNAPASTPADASEPVVITIGRVDVRAVFPTPPPAPRSNGVQQKTMSLDDYLKQRSEGRR